MLLRHDIYATLRHIFDAAMIIMSRRHYDIRH